MNYVVAGDNTPASVAVSGNTITVNLATNATGVVLPTMTAANIAANVNANPAAALLVTASSTGTGVPSANFSGTLGQATGGNNTLQSAGVDTVSITTPANIASAFTNGTANATVTGILTVAGTGAGNLSALAATNLANGVSLPASLTLTNNNTITTVSFNSTSAAATTAPGDLILGGSLALENANITGYNTGGNIGNLNLNAVNATNTIANGGLTAVTLGGLNGNKTLDISNLTFTLGNNNVSSTYAGILASATGPATLVKTGNGTLVLVNNSTFNTSASATPLGSNVTVNNGTLQLGNATLQGMVPGSIQVLSPNISNGTIATLTLAEPLNFTYGNVVFGSGNLTQNGNTPATQAAGTTALTNANSNITYTAVAAGTAGNAFNVSYVNPGTQNSPLSFTVNSTNLVVSLATSNNGVNANATTSFGNNEDLLFMSEKSGTSSNGITVSYVNPGTFLAAPTIASANATNVVVDLATTAATAANATMSTNQLSFTAKAAGAQGDNIQVVFATPSGASDTVTVSGNIITVTPKTGGDSPANIVTALGNATLSIAPSLITAAVGSNSTGNFTTSEAATTLANGTNLTINATTNTATAIANLINSNATANAVLTANIAPTQTGAGDVTTLGTFTLANGANASIASNMTAANILAAELANSSVTGNVTPSLSGTGAGLVTAFGPITLSGATAAIGNTLTLTGANTYTGNTTVSQGTLQIGNGTAGSISPNSSISLASSTNLIIDEGPTITLSNPITGAGNVFILQTNPVTLTATNFTGGTYIGQGGTLVLGGNTALANSTLNLILGNSSANGALSFGTLTNASIGELSGNENLVLSSGSTPLTLTLGNNTNAAAAIYTGNLSGSVAGTNLIKTANSQPLTLAGTLTFNGNITTNGTLTLSGNVQIGGGINVNNGTLTLSGPNNTYTGGTTINSTATAQFNSASSFGTGQIVVNNGTLQWNGPNVSAPNLDISSHLTNGIATGNVTLNLVNTGGVAENVTFNSAIGGSGNLIIQGFNGTNGTAATTGAANASITYSLPTTLSNLGNGIQVALVNPEIANSSLGVSVANIAANLATGNTASNNGITYSANTSTASVAGIFGNNITIAYVNGNGLSVPTTASVTGNVITVTLGTDATGNLSVANTTAQSVINAINANSSVKALVNASLTTGDTGGTGLVIPQAATTFTGGATTVNVSLATNTSGTLANTTLGTSQPDAAVTFTAPKQGAAAVTIAYVNPGVANSTLGVASNSTATNIVINLATDANGNVTTTAAQIASLIGNATVANATFSNGTAVNTVVYASLPATDSVGGGVVPVQSATWTAGTAAGITSNATQVISAINGNTSLIVASNTTGSTGAGLVTAASANLTGGVNAGVLTLNAADPNLNGPVNITNGTLLLGNNNALQNATLNYGPGAGVLQFAPGILSPNIGTVNLTANLQLTTTAGQSITLIEGGNNQTTTFTGTLSGTTVNNVGNLTKIGTGILFLGANNTFNGTTTISGGEINFSFAGNYTTYTQGATATNFGYQPNIVLSGGGLQWGAGVTVDLSPNITIGGTNALDTIDTNGQNVALASTGFSGTGVLVKAGGGTLTLTQPETYSGVANASLGLGTTIITGGALQLGNGSTSGIGSVATGSNITDNAILIYNEGVNTTVNNLITGTGGLVENGINTGQASNTTTFGSQKDLTFTAVAGGNLTYNISYVAPTALGATPSVTVSGGSNITVHLGSVSGNANLTTNVGANANILYTAKTTGGGGNSDTVTYVAAGNNTPLSLAVSGSNITVNLATNATGGVTSTANQVLAALAANTSVTALVTPTIAPGNDGTAVVAALSQTPLANGTSTPTANSTAEQIMLLLQNTPAATTLINAVLANGENGSGVLATTGSPIVVSGGSSSTAATSLTLNAANTFNGTTSIQAGTLILGVPLALQDSTLNYVTTGGAL